MATVHIDRLLEACIKMGGSDLHIVTGRPPVLRIRGRLRSLDTKVMDPDDTSALMKSITPDKNQQELQETGSTDFGFAFGDKGRFRTAIFKQRSHISMVLRLIPYELLSFEQIGLPKVAAALCRRPRGLFLVTGPTGSGKSTTLASMIDYINTNLDVHIITVEEPIEYYHYHKKAIVNQREVGIDVTSFAEALKRALRQDPDVILVGELRDLETIEAAITAAETGHLVFGTLHTTGCQGTINRLIDAFPVSQQEQIRVQLSTNLIAVLSQTLCPLKGGKGRVAAYEFMLVTPAISNLIRENKTYRIESSIQTGKNVGMQLLDDHLWDLYAEDKIELQEMLDKARNPSELKEKADAKARREGKHLEDIRPIIGA
ncbi:Twitching mobility protein [Anaerohalosphaera lusitana]|uniref:Twitching mobility protein n=1 Tax=Anaerohalosphaera lusitana TaxID=1936003 RepID=A0A1U9NKT0_9BACT|nr:type IV pilus twitching motility protein PilT [Anaerohalosphaera lusitana]AQT68519.1 Twitching mobility protein [Anaerohalosphaera lusitana]